MTFLNGRTKGIAFVRALPDGRNVVQYIEAPPELDQAAARFVAAGGRYFIALMPDEQHTKLACAFPHGGELRTIFQTECDNGPGLLTAIGLLVRMSISHLNEVT